MKQLLQKWWFTPLLIVLVASCVAIAILLKSAKEPSGSSFNCAGSKSTQFSCYKEQLIQKVNSQGPEAATSALKAAYQRNSYVQGQCHQLTHVIGQTAAKKYPDVGTAYLHGDSFCWSGYYHGVMQGIAGKIGFENLHAQANTICQSVAEGRKHYGFDHFNCVHGLGHGFMGIQSNELFTSLSTCDVLNDQWEKESCYGGVFMENIMAYQSADTTTKYLRADDALYPCTAVDATYKHQCYLMQTSHALVVKNGDFREVFKVCAQVAEEQFQATCYQSLGRDASGQSNSDPIKTKDTCLRGGNKSAQTNCAVGAVKDFISYFHSDKQGLAFCEGFEDNSIKATCMETGREYFKLL